MLLLVERPLRSGWALSPRTAHVSLGLASLGSNHESGVNAAGEASLNPACEVKHELYLQPSIR